MLQDSGYFINIDVNQPVGELKDEIFGGALSAPSSGLFQSGFSIALKDMGVKLLRINGGNFIQLDPDNNPRLIGPFTRVIGPLSNRIDYSKDPASYHNYPAGPDEWGKRAREAGAELMITLPFGEGEDRYKNNLKNLVEYMNVPLTSEIENRAQTEGWQAEYSNPDGNHSWSGFNQAPPGYFAWLRKQANGGIDPGPYRVKYWEIGNEVYGGWMPFKVQSDAYIQKAIEFSEAMKQIDANIEVGAVLEGGWGESPWDTDNSRLPHPIIWDEVIINASVRDGLIKKSQGKPQSIDFLIPHYYGPGLIGSNPPQRYFQLFNPMRLQYKFPDGSVAGIPSEPVAHVRSITLGPGNYSFSLEAYGHPAAEGAVNVSPRLKLRVIDDGGDGNVSASPSLVINQSGEVKNAGEALIDNLGPQPKTYAFTLDGLQDKEPVTVTLNKPTQEYRLEIIFSNHVWRNNPKQLNYQAQVSRNLIRNTDYIAQSFVANDNIIDFLKLYLQKTSDIDPGEANNTRVRVEIYPDSNGVPDMSRAPVGRYSFNVSRVPVEGTGYNPIDFVKADSNQMINVVQGNTYWAVMRLDYNLSLGAILAFGSFFDGYIQGELKTKSNESDWVPDTNAKDLYFVVHRETPRDVGAKNIRVIDGNGQTQLTMLDEKEWFEALVLSADRPEDHLNKTREFVDVINREYKSLYPQLASVPNYIPQIMTTEFSYLGTGGTEANGMPTNRLYYPALYDANSFVAFINNHIDGAMVWSTGSFLSVFKYQDPWNLFAINNGDRDSPETDNPALYMYYPRYYLFKLLAQNRGKELVKTAIASPNYTYRINFGWSMLPRLFSRENPQCNDALSMQLFPYYWQCSPTLLKLPLYNRPYLNGYASYDSSNRRLYLTVVNGNVDQNITTRINIAGFIPAGRAKARTFNTEDNAGMNTVNGEYSVLTEPVVVNSNEIRVQDSSIYKEQDLISIQAYCSGHEEFYNISSIDSQNNRLYLNDLNGAVAQIPCFGSSWRNDYSKWCAPYNCGEVIRVTNRVGITEPEIDAANSFFYTFPAHSVSVLEFEQMPVTTTTSLGNGGGGGGGGSIPSTSTTITSTANSTTTSHITQTSLECSSDETKCVESNAGKFLFECVGGVWKTQKECRVGCTKLGVGGECKLETNETLANAYGRVLAEVNSLLADAKAAGLNISAEELDLRKASEFKDRGDYSNAV
ncbi:hypothetical protein HY991_00260, partial [Candidatus Micrarchaeota archaeon]|nr:hypothetical protein [Candidatus Micrarchaeota archaeon]